MFVPMSLQKTLFSFIGPSAVDLEIRKWRENRLPKSGLTFLGFIFLQGKITPNCHYFVCSLMSSYRFTLNILLNISSCSKSNSSPKHLVCYYCKRYSPDAVFKPLNFIEFCCQEFHGPDAVLQDKGILPLG